MAVLQLPDNLKVHFASAEVQNQFIACQECGVSYSLYTCFPFVERMTFGKGKSPIMPLKSQLDCPQKKIPQNVINNQLHTIQDSGLFTLMFGSFSKCCNNVIDEKTIEKWYENLITFSLENAKGATCVEVDCQKLLGVEKAWSLRERMKRDLPNRQINVFHLEDGKKGLERLIEFSDYIAISVPELRNAGKKDLTYRLASFIKNKKPNIDIHLLGCTEFNLLKQCRFCTSSDSTTYTQGKRFGFINGKHVSALNENILNFKDYDFDFLTKYNSLSNVKTLLFNIESCKRKYEKSAGNQDFYKAKKLCITSKNK